MWCGFIVLLVNPPYHALELTKRAKEPKVL